MSCGKGDLALIGLVQRLLPSFAVECRDLTAKIARSAKKPPFHSKHNEKAKPQIWQKNVRHKNNKQKTSEVFFPWL
jgi:cytochrome c556